MKIKINYDELNKLKFSSKNSVFLENKVNLFQQIKLGNHLTCLISGYRGVGKSTLVKDMADEIINQITKIEESVTEEKEINIEKEILIDATVVTTTEKKIEKTIKKSNPKLVLFQNIDKYDEYTLFLRKIIRQLYLEISKNELVKNKIMENSSSLFDRIESLYENTYLDKKHMSYDSKMSNKLISVESDSGSISFKDLSPVLLPIITSIGVYTNVINTYVNKFTIVMSILFLFFKNWKFKTKSSKSNEKKVEVLKQTLYDDEIAEYQLFLIFEELKKLSIDVYIVLDEMDKVENASKLKLILSELKHFLLFESISTIVISGQHLLYESYQSSFEDDGMLSNIFSIKLHVPLQNTSEIQSSIKKVFKDDVNDSELLALYIKHIIYQSKRVSRNILNNLYNELIWEDSEVYININDSNREEYAKDAKLLKLLEKFEKDVVRKNIQEDGIVDMIVYHLFIWIKKMEQKVIFSDKDIIDIISKCHESKEETRYPVWIEEKQKKIFYLFLTYLESEGIIKETESTHISSEEIREGITFYSWNNPNNEIKDKNLHWKYLESYIQFEQIIGRVCLNYSKTRQLINEKLKILLAENIIDKKSFETINELKNYRNKLAHGTDVDFQNWDNEIDKLILEQDKLVKNFIESIFSDNDSFNLVKDTENSKDLTIKYNDFVLYLIINRRYDYRNYIELEEYDLVEDNKINIILDYSENTTEINIWTREKAEVIDISTFSEKVIINKLEKVLKRKLKKVHS